MIIFSIFILLVTNALNIRKERSVFYSRISILVLLSCLIISYNSLFANNFDKGVSLFGGLFNVTAITQCFNIFILIITCIILIFNSFYHKMAKINIIDYNEKKIFNRKLNEKKYNQYFIVEYPLIILFIILGSIFLMSSSDLISLFISIELQSYGLYILCTLYRNSEKATWGGLTYFLLGGLSSCFILLASALLYINSGTTTLEGIYIINSISEITSNIENYVNYVDFFGNTSDINNHYYLYNGYDSYYINISLIILSVGFLFKISAAPFHFWSPDVYDSIPTVVTTAVAIIAKLSIFVILLELTYYINKDFCFYSWKTTILISSLLSLIIGSILGLTQYRIKRVYAYSTISHIGFILLALGVDKVESIQAYIFYIITYTVSNLNAFIILIAIGYSIYTNTNVKKIGYKFNDDFKLSNELFSKNDKKYLNSEYTDKDAEKVTFLNRFNTEENYNSPLQLISQLKGYFYVNSYLALSLSITLFSFVGIPPLVGFFAKQMVLSAALDNGYIFITLIAIITSVIAAAYYLNIVKQMFFFKNNSNINASTNLIINNNNFKLSTPISVIISILTLTLLLFIFIPNESFNIAKILTLILYN